MPGASAGEPVMLPASYAQELMWLLERASPGVVAYNVPRTRRLVGALDVSALRRAFDALVARHEILRTTYATVNDEAVQVIHASREVPFEVVDLRAMDPSTREADAARVIADRSARPFDLAKDLLLRVTLVQLDSAEHLLLFESHHIAFDGWSRDIVFRELSTFYEAFVAKREAQLPPLPIQVADFAIWQRQQMADGALARLLDWWRAELDGAEFELRLPTDFPRGAVASGAAVSESITLPVATRNAVAAVGKQSDATLYMVLLAAYATVLHRYTGQESILVGSPSAGRTQVETHGLIGYFANTLVQRARFAGEPTFREVLTRLRESALGAFDHQDVPFEKLALELQGVTSGGQSPLFQVVFTQLDASDAPEARLGDVRLLSVGSESTTTKFDLTFFMGDRPAGLELTLRARRDLHAPSSVHRFLGHMQTVLEAVVANPDVRVHDIDIRTAAERDATNAAQGPKVDEGAQATVIALFESQVDRVGARVAVIGSPVCSTMQAGLPGTVQLTYAELDARANQLAHRLRSAGVVRGARVGLLHDRSVPTLVGLLGILKAGGAYVPLPVEAPAPRLAQVLNESGATVVVSHTALAAHVPSGITVIALDGEAQALAALPSARLAHVSEPSDIAYVLFTSGSTGVPKGVAVTHANVVHYARAVSRVLADTPVTLAGDGFAALDGWQFGQVSTFAADLGLTALVPSLLAGGTLHVLPKAVTTEPPRYAEYLREHPLDLLKITPSHLRALVAGGVGTTLASLLPARWVVLGGEALAVDLARTLLGAGPSRVLNHYGPTETTVGVLTFATDTAKIGAAVAQGAQTVPIGRPLGNTTAFVVDARGREQPVGIPGELWIGGEGVTRGYLGRDDLTAERFTLREGTRVYHTGDRVRRLADQSIEFLGRVDEQVKVRGFRVELGEIAHMLRTHEAVEAAEVVLRLDHDEPTLVGYVVARRSGYAASHGERLTGDAFIQWLATRLPEYMVPSHVLLLDALPLTPNGKVDRAKLPAPDARAGGAEVVAPRTDTERRLLDIWRDVLKQPTIGVTQRFVDLGGHSLLAIRILGKISKGFGVRLSLGSVFEAPTVAQLAELLDVEVQLAMLDAMKAEESPGA